MNCPSCKTPLEPNARFCGVCGHQLADPVAPDDPYVGKTLNNRFKIESKLGEGGFGAVYKATQVQIGRVVAVKLLHPEMTRDGNLVARFRREGLVMCGLKDAHTITTYDFDQTPDGTLYIAMELLEGRSLHDVFHDEAPIDWRRMLKIVSAICSSLSEAHAQGIVHRDLKPENIHLENRPGNAEFVKVLDFGIAKVMRGDGPDKNSPQLTATGQTLGTLEYMSPEQLMGKQLDGRSDVYALGVVCFELITGRLPFPDAKGPAGLITAQLRQTPEDASAAHPSGGIPPGADQLIQKCLEKDKNKRWANADEMRRAVDRVLASSGAALNPAPAPAAAAVPAHSGPQPVQPPVVNTPAPVRQAPPQAQPYAPPQARAPQQPPASQPGPATDAVIRASKGDSRLWLWVVVGILIVGGGVVGAVLALQ